jgi:aminopeptidase-like protein
MKEGARPSLQAIQWLLNLSDGSNDLVEIARRSRLQYAELRDAAEELAAHSLLSRIA